MILQKDNMILPMECPFMISKQCLERKDNVKESFHWHSFLEITFVIKGTGYYYVNNRQYSMAQGDLIIFNNAEPHGWEVSGERMELLVMVFAPSFVAGSPDTLNSAYLKPFIERGSNFLNKLSSTDAITVKIGEILYETFQETQRQSDGYLLMAKANVLRILTYLFRYYKKADNEREVLLEEKKKTMGRLEEAFSYINLHYSEKLTLDEVAGTVFMSPNYFSSYFKKVTDKSFIDYVTELRLKKAENMLKNTDYGTVRIAMECGFLNMSNFYRLYRKKYGKGFTPGKLKRPEND